MIRIKIDPRGIPRARWMPGYFHFIYFLGGILTLGVLWVVWLLHFLIYSLFITIPGHWAAKRARIELNRPEQGEISGE